MFFFETVVCDPGAFGFPGAVVEVPNEPIVFLVNRYLPKSLLSKKETEMFEGSGPSLLNFVAFYTLREKKYLGQKWL